VLPVRRAHIIANFNDLIVMKYCSLNLPETKELFQACEVIALSSSIYFVLNLMFVEGRIVFLSAGKGKIVDFWC
jgi:hypothetical protein